MTKRSPIYKYKKEFIAKADEYLASKKDTVVNGKIKIALPTVEDFAINCLRVSRKSVYNWEKEHPAFFRALDRIRAVQKQRLMEEGLAGNYNSAIAKLILSANHDMREKSDMTTNDEPISAFSDDQIDRIAERIARRKAGDGDASS